MIFFDLQVRLFCTRAQGFISNSGCTTRKTKLPLPKRRSGLLCFGFLFLLLIVTSGYGKVGKKEHAYVCCEGVVCVVVPVCSWMLPFRAGKRKNEDGLAKRKENVHVPFLFSQIRTRLMKARRPKGMKEGGCSTGKR